MKSYRTVVLAFALVGFLVPVIVLLADWVLKGWFPDWIRYIWPTWLLLLPYPGFAVDPERLLVIVLSAALNAVVYGVIGFAVAWGMTRLRAHAHP